MEAAECPLPHVDFNKFCQYQSEVLLAETDLFFKQHNLRLRKYVLPVKLPEWAKTFGDVLDRGEEHEPLTSIYRHKHFLKCRVLHNYSYIETKWNRNSDPRNKKIPFDLRPLSTEILNQLDTVHEDILDPEFSGLLVTVNTTTYTRPKHSSPKQPKGTNSTGQGATKNGVKKGTEADDAQKEGKISKIIAGALVECLVTNERCIKSIWIHPELTKHSSRVLLQSFLPRLMYEIFMLPSVVTEEGVSTYNKFTYCMHNDLDLFPRQCWLLFASNKKMSLPRHYEPSTFEEHPVNLDYGDCHTDEVGYAESWKHLPPTSEEDMIELERNGHATGGTNGAQNQGAAKDKPASGQGPLEGGSTPLDKGPEAELSLNNLIAQNVDPHENLTAKSASQMKAETSTKRSRGPNDKLVSMELLKGAEAEKAGAPGMKRPHDDIADNFQVVQKRGEAQEPTRERRSQRSSVIARQAVRRSVRVREPSRSKEAEMETKPKHKPAPKPEQKPATIRRLFASVGSVSSTRDVACSCRKEKLKKTVDDQAWLDRLVGCTENYMYLMLPKREERPRLGLLVRDGWRDLVTTHQDNTLMYDINNILPEHARDPTLTLKTPHVNYNADVEEWCRLRREDLIDVTSDTEVYMRMPENYSP